MASIYAYTARNGEGGFVAGSLQADNREQALAHLRTRTLYVTSIAPADSARGMIGSIITGGLFRQPLAPRSSARLQP